MKYCTHCGKELLDEAVICVGCGCAVEDQKASKSRPKEKKPKKPINVKKLIISLAVAFTVLLIAVGGFIGFRIVSNNNLAANLKSQIAGKTFEYKEISEDYSVFNVRWISFTEDYKYSLEGTDTLYYYELETEEGDYSVNVEFDGSCELLVGVSTYGITLDENREIEYISQSGQKYYPFVTKKGDNLTLFIDHEKHEYEVQRNKEEAINTFYTYFNYKIEDFEELIPVIFKDYEFTVEYVENQEPYIFEYIVTISGEYYVHKLEFPNLTEEGEISCRILIHDALGSDITMLSGSDILSAMNLYSVLNKYSYY